MKIKAVLIFTAFVICIVLVVISRQAASGDFSIHRVVFFEKDNQWDGFKFNNMSLNQDSSRLLIVSPDQSGSFESPSVKTEFEFNEILLSWNCDIDMTGGLYFTLSVSPDNENWYELFYQKWGEADFVRDNAVCCPSYSSLISSAVKARL